MKLSKLIQELRSMEKKYRHLKNCVDPSVESIYKQEEHIVFDLVETLKKGGNRTHSVSFGIKRNGTDLKVWYNNYGSYGNYE